MAVQIWLISDTHFFHDNLYTFTEKDGTRIRHPFTSARECDAFMMQRWCECVKPQDHIYHLGDVTMWRSNDQREAFINYTHSMPGHKRLILGNHDHFDVEVYKEAGFEKIMGSNRLNVSGVQLQLTHYPIHEGSIGKAVNIHGHIHQNPSPPGRYVNMSVERWEYSPVPIEVVVEAARVRMKDFPFEGY